MTINLSLTIACWRTFLAVVVLPMACSSFSVAQSIPDYVSDQFGHPPPYAEGPLTDAVSVAIEDVLAKSFTQTAWDPEDAASFAVLETSGDARLGWLLIDLMRFTWSRPFNDALEDTALSLLGIEPTLINRRHEITDHMLAWDIPAYPSYLRDKSRIYSRYLPKIAPLFAEGEIEWHKVSWGGVEIDTRPYDATDEVCHCIPAADNPPVTTAEEADWLDDDAIIFGIEINGEARAYPLQIMEVREMVNDTLGGRDIGIPYCSLCGAAQAYFTDRMPSGIKRPVLRTSGLLIRSNKVMYDVNTQSVFDTFRGIATTGPLAEAGVVLEPLTIVTSDWGSWRTAHPNTTVLIEDLALGRDFNLRHTRDANGPIFPVGDVDPRLPVHEDIIGVVTAEGQPVAFQRSKALLALLNDQPVKSDGIRLERSAGGLIARNLSDASVPSHQAFWFAWSQFHPTTRLWPD